jgi:hypothetical protein
MDRGFEGGAAARFRQRDPREQHSLLGRQHVACPWKRSE